MTSDAAAEAAKNAKNDPRHITIREKRSEQIELNAAATSGQQSQLDPAPGQAEGVNSEEEGARGTYAEGALQFRQMQMRDENGFIPADGYQKAREQVERMKSAQRQRLKARPKTDAEPQAAGIEPNSWEALGPGNIGGRIRAIVIHPNTPNDMWIGSVSGGIWRTTNGGASWFPVDDFLASLAVSTLIINPVNPSTMYAGTGEGLYGLRETSGFIDAIRGAGVFKSTDGGVTWKHLQSTSGGNWFYVNRLAVSPDGNTLLAATTTGVWRSTDAGVSWTQRTFVSALDVDFHPTNNGRVMAAESGGARLSTDGGLTWSFVDSGGTTRTRSTFTPAIAGRVELAYAPSSPGTIYASVNQNGGELYRSTNGGETFTKLSAALPSGMTLLGGQGEYGNIIWVNPRDPSFVIIGGVNLWRSTDSGANFTAIANGTANSTTAHDDHHMIVAHPRFDNASNRTVYFGNDGGIYRTLNVSTVNLPAPGSTTPSGWEELNNTLSITQFYGVAGSPATGTIIGGTQDNGTLRFNSGTDWTTVYGGDGGFSAVDPTDPNRLYGEYVYLGIFRSINGSVRYIYCNPPPTLPGGGTNPNGGVCTGTGIADAFNGANFIAPIMLDPNNPHTMLAGGVSLWRSTDVRDATNPAWGRIKSPTAGSSPISAIAVSPISSALILVGHNDGDIYRTINGQLGDSQVLPSWTKIDTAALPNGRMVTRLVIDPNHSTNWYYVTFGGFSPDNVWRSTDNGATWVDITGAGATGLPDVPVRTLVYHPTDPNLLYVGTEIGIFTSQDAGATWEPTQDGPANVSVDELVWMGGNLLAATHGRGIYRASGGIYVDRNAGFLQFGTFDFPFKTVTQGKNFATRYQPIWIRPGNYNETMTIDNPNGLELRALGGPVTIGSP